jgi:hypothetical protein
MSDEVVASFCKTAAAFAPPLFCEGVKRSALIAAITKVRSPFPTEKGKTEYAG